MRVTAKRDIVAIVDDDDGVRGSLRFLSEAAGYTVEAFAAATDLLNADHQNIACLPLDQQMPAMTGRELANSLSWLEGDSHTADDRHAVVGHRGARRRAGNRDSAGEADGW